MTLDAAAATMHGQREPRASVVMCTFNGEAFLGEQFDSLLGQTRLPDRIVVVDDASQDGTWPMVQAFAVRAGQAGIDTAVFRNAANLGYARNFSSALAHACGEVVFLCDQDDIWHPDKIATMLAQFRRRPRLGLLHTDADLVDRDGRGIGHGLFDALEVTRAELRGIHAGHAFDVLLRRNLVTGATAAVRRDVLDALLPVPDDWPHDEWLGLGATLCAEVDCLEWKSIGYRQHGGNQIGVRRRTGAEKIAGAGRPDKRAYMRQLVDRMLAVQQWVGASGRTLSAGQARDMDARIAHARVRASLPVQWHARLPVVLVEIRTGRYARYSAGTRSVLSDLAGLG